MAWICYNVLPTGDECGNTILENPSSLWLRNNRNVTIRTGVVSADCKRCGNETTFFVDITIQEPQKGLNTALLLITE